MIEIISELSTSFIFCIQIFLLKYHTDTTFFHDFQSLQCINGISSESANTFNYDNIKFFTFTIIEHTLKINP